MSGGDRQGECGDPGEIRQADRATMQRRHTARAMLDQVSLQLCLHSGLINMTEEAGSHTRPHLNAHTSRCNNLWLHLHALYCRLVSLLPDASRLASFKREWVSNCDRSSSIIRITGNTKTYEHTCRRTENQRINEAEVNLPLNCLHHQMHYCPNGLFPPRSWARSSAHNKCSTASKMQSWAMIYTVDVVWNVNLHPLSR